MEYLINSKGVKGSRLIQSSIIIMNALTRELAKQEELNLSNKEENISVIKKQIREHAEGISDIMHESFFLLSPERQEELFDWDEKFGL